MADFKDVIDTLDKAADGFDNIANAEQKKIYEEVVTLAKDLETDAQGKVKQTITNLKRLNQIKAKLAALSKDKEWVAGIGKFVKYFDILQKQQNAYFSQNFHVTLGESAKKRNEMMKQIAVNNTIEALMGDGLKANVTDKLNDILLRGVTSGAKWADLQQELRDHLMGKEGGKGAFARYATTYATTALSQYTGQHNQLMTKDLGLEWFMYVGSNIETTREFCEVRTKKKWIHKSEIPTILQGKIEMPDGEVVEVEIYDKTGLPKGMIADTTPENFQCNCGGWNCRHQLLPVADAMVPAAIRAKFEKPKEPAKPQPVDLAPYQEQVSAIEQYIATHPKSNKLKGYLAGVLDAAAEGNQSDLESILKAAKKDMNKFLAAEKVNEKKKAEKKALAEAAANAANDVAWNDAVNDMVDAHGKIADYKWDGKDELLKAFKNHDIEALKQKTQEMIEYKQKMQSLTMIPNLDKWAQSFTYEQLKDVEDYVSGHIKHWKNAGKDIIKKLSEEPNYIKHDDAHPTANVLEDALAHALSKAQDEKDWTDITAGMAEVQDYVSTHKSEKMKNYLIDLADAVSKKDKTKAKQVLKDAIKYKKNQEAAKKSAAKKKMGMASADDSKDIELNTISKEIVEKLEKAFKGQIAKGKYEKGLDYIRGLSPKERIKFVEKINDYEFTRLLDQWNKLSDDEKDQLYKYTYSYSYLNEPLRGMTYIAKTPEQKKKKAAYEKDLKTMTEALKKCRTDKDMTIRRGSGNYHIRGLMKYLSDVEPGDEFVDGGFLSSAMHPSFGFGGSINMIIFVPKGSMGIYAEPFSYFGKSPGGTHGNFDGKTDVVKNYGAGHEYEWIGQRGSKFRVVKKEEKDTFSTGASTTIYLELIGQLYDQP